MSEPDGPRCTCGSPYDESERVVVPSPDYMTVFGYCCSECKRPAVSVREINVDKFMAFVRLHFGV